ncbi:MAG: HP0495 family protein [Candidatus Xenobia bacterium]
MEKPTVTYPTDYMFKVMGEAAEDFSQHVEHLISPHTGPILAENLVTRQSNQGRYQSVTVRVRLESEEQRRAIYQALHDDPRVVTYL